jgi:hypothetical protein
MHFYDRRFHINENNFRKMCQNREPRFATRQNLFTVCDRLLFIFLYAEKTNKNKKQKQADSVFKVCNTHILTKEYERYISTYHFLAVIKSQNEFYY